MGAMLWRILVPSEPAWETGDDRAKLEGSQGVATSSPLNILLVGAPGACKIQPMQFSGVRVGGGARQGGIDEKSAMKIAQKIRLKQLPDQQ